MRSAFSYVEVLISVAILAFLGTALIKFNAFNKRAMEKNIRSQEILLLSSGFLFEKKTEGKKDMILFDLVKFTKLEDDDKKFLESVTMKVSSKTEDTIFLGSDGKEDLYLEYGNLKIEYKDFTQNYLWLQKAK